MVLSNLIYCKKLCGYDGRLLAHKQFLIAGFFVLDIINNGVAEHELVIRPPIAYPMWVFKSNSAARVDPS